MPAVMEKIEGVEARRAELAAELDGARQVLEQAKAALIAGEGDAVAVEEARARVGALQEAVDSLTADRDRLEAEQAQAGRTARREAKVEALLQLDKRASDAFRELEALRAAVAEAAGKAILLIPELEQEIEQAAAEFFLGARELAPAFVSQGFGDPPRDQARQASTLAGELLKRGGDFTVINTKAYRPHSLMRAGQARPEDFGPVVEALDEAVKQERKRLRLGIG